MQFFILKSRKAVLSEGKFIIHLSIPSKFNDFSKMIFKKNIDMTKITFFIFHHYKVSIQNQLPDTGVLYPGILVMLIPFSSAVK